MKRIPLAGFERELALSELRAWRFALHFRGVIGDAHDSGRDDHATDMLVAIAAKDEDLAAIELELTVHGTALQRHLMPEHRCVLVLGQFSDGHDAVLHIPGAMTHTELRRQWRLQIRLGHQRQLIGASMRSETKESEDGQVLHGTGPNAAPPEDHALGSCGIDA